MRFYRRDMTHDVAVDTNLWQAAGKHHILCRSVILLNVCHNRFSLHLFQIYTILDHTGFSFYYFHFSNYETSFKTLDHFQTDDTSCLLFSEDYAPGSMSRLKVECKQRTIAQHSLKMIIIFFGNLCFKNNRTKHLFYEMPEIICL